MVCQVQASTLIRAGKVPKLRSRKEQESSSAQSRASHSITRLRLDVKAIEHAWTWILRCSKQQESQAVHLLLKCRRKARFPVRTKKVEIKKKPEVFPVVGQYDTSLETIEGEQRRKEALARRADKVRQGRSITGNAFRFFTPLGSRAPHNAKHTAKDCEHLGPGCYGVPQELDSALFKFQGRVFVPRDGRFKSKRSEVPGPGYYQRSEADRWNKKTFNLLFNSEKEDW